MTLEYHKGDKLRYIGTSDISFSNGSISEIIDIFKLKGINIIVIKDPQGEIHKYNEAVVNRCFITSAQYRETIINNILKV